MTLLRKFFVDKVLLIDDSDTDNYIHNKYIKSTEFAEHVIIKNSARDALDYLINLEKNADAVPDVIFLDINMPIINGFGFLDEFANLSLQIQNKSKVIILTTSDHPRDISQVSDNSIVKEYLNKPLNEKNLDELKSTLNFYMKFENF